MPLNRKVLDLSHHNVVTNWQQVKAAGIVGIIHKATEGSTFVDDMYYASRKDASQHGLLWGAYHFLRPGDMIAQAKHFVKIAGNDPKTLYAADHEDVGVELDDLSVFLTEVCELTGQMPIIYSGHLLKDQLAGMNTDKYQLNRYRLWLAHYNSTPSWPPQWEEPWLWQYSDGQIGPQPHGCPGVSGHVDTNHFEGTDAELRGSWNIPVEDVPEIDEAEDRLVVTIELPPSSAAQTVILSLPPGTFVRSEKFRSP